MQKGVGSYRLQRISTLSLCLLLSLALHVVLAMVLVLTADSPSPRQQKRGGHKRILITRAAHKKEKASPPQENKPQEQKPFAKTDADRPQQRPDNADFEGQRNARAEGMNNNTRQSDAPIPTMEGEEKEELNTLQQERQDGDVQHYGKNEAQPATPPQVQQAEPTPTTPPVPTPPRGEPDTPPTPQPDTGSTPTPTEPETTTTQATIPADTEGDLKLTPPREDESVQEEPKEDTATPPQGVPQGQDEAPAHAPIPPPANTRRPVYDPTQADHAQPPGLRTTERRTRSTGQFVIGRMPSCHVEATPRGQYEELVYRLIAAQWYFACDQHRGDIIPGTLIIAIRLNTRGGVESMNLVNRRGASVSQQSFTFAAIRRAQFPQMPKAVVKTLVGNLMELIITFDFN